MILKKLNNSIAVAVFFTLFMQVSEVVNADLYQPPDVGSGEHYHLAFVTSGKTTANSADIDFYNLFVNSSANAAGMGEVLWSVIGSSPLVNARDNALVSAPVYLLDGTKIADGFADMWDDTILAPLNVTEQGSVLGEISVWTGSGGDGIRRENFGSGTVAWGSTDRINHQWMRNGFVVPSNNFALYALSPQLTGVPEPSSFAIVILGFAGWGIPRRR